MKESLNIKHKKLREDTDVDILIGNKMITKDYSNLILTNVVDEVWTKRKIRSVMEILAKTLAATLGPDGSTTVLQRSDHNHLVTKDGLDIIDSINFRDDVSETVLDIVREISQDQVTAVGDGSTSAIIIANAIYQELTDPANQDKFKAVSPQVVVDLLRKLSDWIDGEIKSIAKPISADLHEIDHVAAISMNNNEKAGHMIADVYRKIGKNGIITPDTTLVTDDDFVEYKSGVDWERGYIDPLYATQLKALNGKITHDKPYVFICDGTLTFDNDANMIGTLLDKIFLINGNYGQKMMRSGVSLVIVANKLDQGMRNMLRTNRALKYTSVDGYPYMDYTVVDIAQTSESDVNDLKDLALLCGCHIYSPSDGFRTQSGTPVVAPADVDASIKIQFGGHEDACKALPYYYVGQAAKATITDATTSVVCDDRLITPSALKEKADSIASIQKGIDDFAKQAAMTAKEKNTSALFKQRIANLNMSTAIFHVGGKTIREQASRERLIEDAVYAARSAMKYGYTIGGNLVVPRILTRKRAEAIDVLQKSFSYLGSTYDFYAFFVDLIRDAFLQSYYCVLDNSQYLSDEQVNAIITECVNENKFYNLKLHRMENDEDSEVINSAQTELQIAKSCIGLMSMLAKSNQIITLNLDSTDHFFNAVNKLQNGLNDIK